MQWNMPANNSRVLSRIIAIEAKMLYVVNENLHSSDDWNVRAIDLN